MRYWWVNQNQTYRQEVRGGYIWSPQRRKDGARNPFYESMRAVSPGDVVFSFSDTFIKAVGVARSYCYECPKPLEFGQVGMAWDNVGWRVDVEFREEPIPIRPKDHISFIQPHLPEKYSPLRANGDGLQSIYLTELSLNLAEAIASLMGRVVLDLVKGRTFREPPMDSSQSDGRPKVQSLWEQELVRRIEANNGLSVTEKEQLIAARRGQGEFRRRVRLIEKACRVTKVERLEHLRASHCRPWRDCSDIQRLDGENGLLLTPSIDHLFDRGFISFEDSGRLLVSNVADKASLRRMGIETDAAVNVGTFTDGQKKYLEHHRARVFVNYDR